MFTTTRYEIVPPLSLCSPCSPYLFLGCLFILLLLFLTLLFLNNEIFFGCIASWCEFKSRCVRNTLSSISFSARADFVNHRTHLTKGSCAQVREQRNEYPPVQLLATSLLAAQLHGRLHMVAALRGRKGGFAPNRVGLSMYFEFSDGTKP